MTRPVPALCLALAACLQARALPDSTRDAILEGKPAWDPATGRVAVVEAPVSCCASMLPQLHVLDTRRGRLLETWGPHDIAEGKDSLMAQHNRALLTRLEKHMTHQGVRLLQGDDSVRFVRSSDGKRVSFAFRIDGKHRKTRSMPALSYPASPHCCGVPLDSLETSSMACRIPSNHWTVWSLPELPWALVASYASREPDGCERGPDFRIVRLAP